MRAARGLAGQHRPEVGDQLARDDALLDRRRQLAAVAGLRPLVAEERAGDDRRDRRLRLARAVGAEHVEVQARAQIADVDDRLGARRHAADDVAGQRVGPVAGLPAELVGQRLRDLGARIGAHARPVARGGQAARRPRAVQPAAHDPGRLASSRASAREATAATAPVRSAVTERASSSATGALVVASLSTTTPITVGRPCRGCRGRTRST